MTNHDKKPFLPEALLLVAEKVMAILDQNKISYKVIGGIAVSYHSSARMTEDIDILIPKSQVMEVKKLFQNHSPLMMENADGFTTKVDGIDIDFIVAEDEFFFSAPPHMYHNFPVPSKIHTLILKLVAGRSKDLSDVIQILKSSNPSELTEIKSFFSGYPSNDIREEMSGALEIARLENINTKESKRASRGIFLKLLKKGN